MESANNNLHFGKKKLDPAFEELNLLYEISSAMHTTLDLDHILYIILTAVTSHIGLGYNRALLFLVNEDSSYIEFKMGIGPESGEHANQIWQDLKQSNKNLEDLIQTDKMHPIIDNSLLHKPLKRLRVALSRSETSLLSQAYFRETPWHIPPETILKYQSDKLLETFHTNELIIMPLIAKNKIIGLIVADNVFTSKPISSDDIRLFALLANQAGMAIENSRLYEMVVHKSYTDSITNLWNHGFYQEKLSREVQYALEHNSPLSLLTIDIDNFKQINDNFGHQFGDYILKELAAQLKECSRDKDYVCRYGGEEFSIILIDTNKDQGFEIAERLRKNIEKHIFSASSFQNKINVTVSIGLASLPDDTISKDELISYADKAMYVAKFSGKNKTCTANMI